MSNKLAVIVAALNEADRIEATITALTRVFPDARVVVADDGSTDGTQQVAVAAGAEVVRSESTIGKGGAMTLAAGRLLATDSERQLDYILVCDGDLGVSAERLVPLLNSVKEGSGDLAVANFRRRVGGGFGIAVGFAHWAIRRLTGLKLNAPISGQRLMRREVLDAVTPFEPRFAMEIGMTVDAARAGYRVIEVDLELEHRATGRTLSGFIHRGRQLADFIIVFTKKSFKRRRANG